MHPSRSEIYRALAHYLDVPLEYLMFGETRNRELELAIFHLQRFVHEIIHTVSEQTKKEDGTRVPKTLGQNGSPLFH